MENYFKFTKEEEGYLNEWNEANCKILSKYATKDYEAIRDKEKKINFGIIRPNFSYDIDLIINNPVYNRYADKTQVFSFYKNDDLTRRALHVQFVSKIAKTIGRALRLNLDLIEAIALGHDMGHAPFGHKGEQYLSDCYLKGTEKDRKGNKYFNHNVHSARIFRKILDTNISLQTFSGILAHNGEKVFEEYKPSELASFDEFDTLLENCHRSKGDEKPNCSLIPNTLEGCVVRISDMIAYAGKDRQDYFKTKLESKVEFKKGGLIGTKNHEIVSNLVVNIIKNSIDKPYIKMDKEVYKSLEDLIKENYDNIYNNEKVIKQYEEVIEPLMKELYSKLIFDLDEKDYKSPIFKHYLNDNIQGDFYRDKDNRYITADHNDIVVDYIASMTDDYFIDLCKYLKVNESLTKEIKYKGYFDLMGV